MIFVRNVLRKKKLPPFCREILKFRNFHKIHIFKRFATCFTIGSFMSFLNELWYRRNLDSQVILKFKYIFHNFINGLSHNNILSAGAVAV